VIKLPYIQKGDNMPNVPQRTVAQKLQYFESWGFDKCSYIRGEQAYKIGCSQCQASVLNGVACHEAGCPNDHRVISECHEDE
jgi:hypothetical protein